MEPKIYIRHDSTRWQIVAARLLYNGTEKRFCIKSYSRSYAISLRDFKKFPLRYNISSEEAEEIFTAIRQHDEDVLSYYRSKYK